MIAHNAEGIKLKVILDLTFMDGIEQNFTFSAGQNSCKLARSGVLRRARLLKTKSDAYAVFLVNSLNYAALAP